MLTIVYWENAQKAYKCETCVIGVFFVENVS